MSGMVTTGVAALSDYDNRTVVIEVTGMRQDRMRRSNTTFKVPHARMSQTMQLINRMGGKVVGVTLPGGNGGEAETP
ncbi:MAG: phycobilisome linker polypeptide [Aphanocapsa lilacina HA4352-LM1]|jgi:phycocyanin-associated rod protein|uniref:CpcD protein n=2 Tax=Gloeobacter TaxID=33071 RepID=Q7NL60_GLOVI|nr:MULTISPECIES: phycobilisome linker polypeptide [Gloeobacter]MBW4698876.1 phycobilisome linker polypeptide [Aphanocapsa lilacina HA4352-LM1]UFP94886.1 phycobilisome linker polypeptide [Gloeobacter morelensis MG652769]BAC89207.1 cpcD [Gloeobacter violaceus PCC 7421]